MNSSLYLKETITPELRTKLAKYAKGNDEWRKTMFKPFMSNRQSFLVRTEDGRHICEPNPDFGVDKIIERMLPLINGDRELAQEIIVKEHRKKPDIEFSELLNLVKTELRKKQPAMTTGMREQYIPRRTYSSQRPMEPHVEEKSATDIFLEQQRAIRDAKIRKAMKAFEKYDLKSVNKKCDDGTYIIYEGQRTINGISVDINNEGDVLLKQALEYKPDIPPKVAAMINSWFKYYPDGILKAYEVARMTLRWNPNASLDEIGIAIKESFK